MLEIVVVVVVVVVGTSSTIYFYMHVICYYGNNMCIFIHNNKYALLIGKHHDDDAAQNADAIEIYNKLRNTYTILTSSPSMLLLLLSLSLAHSLLPNLLVPSYFFSALLIFTCRFVISTSNINCCCCCCLCFSHFHRTSYLYFNNNFSSMCVLFARPGTLCISISQTVIQPVKVLTSTSTSAAALSLVHL